MVKLLNLCFISGLIIFSATFSFAQNTPIKGIINRYAVPFAYDSCTGIIAVSDTAGFIPSGKMLVLHTQGAQAATTNNAQFGTVLNLGQVGRYELAEITDRTAATLTIKNRLKFPILPGEVVQLVSFPEFENAVVIDTVYPLPWDGQKGGVVAFKVNGTLTLNAPVIADGMGFRGGVAYIAPNNNCTWLLGESGYLYALGNWRGGTKGEGIVIGQANLELGRGALANGGGGGNDHNSGGGGGANVAAGGQGGENNEPGTFGCDGLFPGLGGKALNNAADRIYLGGGGGAGHTNNTMTSDGGNGGGIIFIEAAAIAGTNIKISANGLAAQLADGDGGGGGGSGGSIWLKVTNLSANAVVRANGGNGGTSSGGNGNRCFGPGGGGGGGRILSNTTTGNILVQPGSAGIVVASTNGCNGSTNGAAAGQSGLVQPVPVLPEGTIPVAVPVILAQPVAQTVCEGDSTAFIWPTNPPASNLQWQVNTGAGWTDIAGESSNILSVPVAAANMNGNVYRCIMDGNSCYYFISDAVLLTVGSAPVPAFTTTPSSPETFIFSNQSQNATGQFWDFGDGISSILENPEHTFTGNGIFEVALTVWNQCDTVTLVQEVVVAMPPVAGFEVADTTAACGSVNVQFVNMSLGAQDFQWSFPGGIPFFSTDENPTVSYSNSGIYNATLIASNVNGSSNISYSFVVESLMFPVADFTSVDLAGGTGVQFNFTGTDAILFTWNFGDGSPVSNEANPIHVFTGAGSYTVRLTVINNCGASVLEQLIIVTDESSSTDVAIGTGMLLKVWPNPATDFVQVYANAGADELTVFDVTGRQFQRWKMPFNHLITIDLRGLPKGSYLVKSGGEQKLFLRM